MRIRVSLVATLVAVTLLSSTGCSARTPQAVLSEKLLGTWFDDQTGAQYRFSPDGMLVVATPQPGGGNAVSYRLIGDDQIDVASGDSHLVSIIETVTASQLVLADPITGRSQALLRDPRATRYAAKQLDGAIAHLKNASAVFALPDIVWDAPKPTGKANEWVDWSTSTLDTYMQTWSWDGIQKTATPIAVAGGGETMGYSFTLRRQLPSEATLTATWTNQSIEATAGLPLIDVGYSAAKAKYPAGTAVYLPGGMIYSLGDGYAIAVGRDDKAQAFAPLTHQ